MSADTPAMSQDTRNRVVLGTVDLEDVRVSQTEAGVEVSRPLHDDGPTSMADVTALADEYGVAIADIEADPDAGELTVVLGGED